MEIINETALLRRCNEWFEKDAPSMNWACRMLHISKATFRDQYAGTKVRIKQEGCKKIGVHPWDVIKLASC